MFITSLRPSAPSTSGVPQFFQFFCSSPSVAAVWPAARPCDPCRFLAVFRRSPSECSAWSFQPPKPLFHLRRQSCASSRRGRASSRLGIWWPSTSQCIRLHVPRARLSLCLPWLFRNDYLIKSLHEFKYGIRDIQEQRVLPLVKAQVWWGHSLCWAGVGRLLRPFSSIFSDIK